MKILFLRLLIVCTSFAIPGIAQGQFYSLNNASPEDAYSLEFYDQDFGLLGAEKIYKTLDGGQTWSATIMTNVVRITDIEFLSASVIVACGESFFNHAIILRSEDAGDSWVVVFNQPITWPLKCLSFDDEQLGFCHTSGSRILKTIDGGESWDVNDTPVNSAVTNMLFHNGELYKSTGQGVFKAIDADGVDWFLASPSYNVYDFFVDQNDKLIILREENDKIYMTRELADFPFWESVEVPCQDFVVFNWYDHARIIGVGTNDYVISLRDKIFRNTAFNDQWFEYDLPAVKIIDIKFLPDESLIACGEVENQLSQLIKNSNTTQAFIPVAYMAIHPDQICLNDQGYFEAYCVMPSDSMHWLINNQWVASGCSFSYVFSSGTFAVITLEVFSAGQVSSSDVSVLLNAIPVVQPFTIVPLESFVCPGIEFGVQISPVSSGVSYVLWEDGIAADTLNSFGTSILTDLGKYYTDTEIIISAISSGSCAVQDFRDTLWVDLTTEMDMPPAFWYSSDVLCYDVDETLTVVNPCQGCTMFLSPSDFTDSQSSSADTIVFQVKNTSVPIFVPVVDCNYSISVPGCNTLYFQDYFSIPAQRTNASFITDDLIIDPMDTVAVSNLSVGADGYLWSTNENGIVYEPTAPEPVIVFPDERFSATIQLVSSTSLGCTDTISQQVTIAGTANPLQGSVCWQFDRGTESGNVLDMCTDFDGNVYMAGYYRESQLPNNFYGGIRKITDSGMLEWEFWLSEGADNNQYKSAILTSVIADYEGNVYAAGLYKGSINFGTTILNNVTNSSKGFLLKINAVGELVQLLEINYIISDLWLEDAEHLLMLANNDYFIESEFSNQVISFNAKHVLVRMTTSGQLTDWRDLGLINAGSEIYPETCNGMNQYLYHFETPAFTSVNDSTIVIAIEVQNDFTIDGQTFVLPSNSIDPLYLMVFDKADFSFITARLLLNNWNDELTENCSQPNQRIYTAMDNNGEFYLALKFRNSYNNMFYNDSIQIPGQMQGVLLGKYNVHGERIWYNFNTEMYPSGVHILDGNKIILIGNTKDDIAFGSTDGDLTQLVIGTEDIVAATYDLNGTLSEQFQLADSGLDYAHNSTSFCDNIVLAYSQLVNDSEILSHARGVLKFQLNSDCDPTQCASLILTSDGFNQCNAGAFEVEWVASSAFDSLALFYSLDGINFNLFASGLPSSPGSYTTADFANYFSNDSLIIQMVGYPQLVSSTQTYILNDSQVSILPDSISSCSLVPTSISTLQPFETYAWSDETFMEEFQFNPTTNFMLSVEVTDANHCQYQDSAMVYVFPVPYEDLTANDYELCDDETAIIYAPDGLVAYAWENGSTADSLIVDEPGQYFCTITNEYNCSSIQNIVIDECSFLEEGELAEWKLFPNPVLDNIVLSCSRPMDVEMKIYAETGELILANSYTNDMRIAVVSESWSSGIYLIKLETPYGVTTVPIVKL